MDNNDPNFPTIQQVSHTSNIQAAIDAQQKQLESPWLGTLPFCIDAYGDGHFSHHENICQLMQNASLSRHIIRFSPLEYQPHQDNGLGLDLLVRDICLRAREQGVELVSGGGNRPPMMKSLVCSCSLINKKSGQKCGKENQSTSLYRVETLHNDRKNNRNNGHRSQPRRCTTKKRLTTDDPMCTFRLNLYKDEKSFYIKIGSGCAWHRYHTARDISSIRLPSRFINKDDATLFYQSQKASISKNAARSLFFIRSGGDILSKHQIATITGNADPDKSSTMDVKQALQDLFEREKAECCFLYHQQMVQSNESNLPSLDNAGGLNEYHSSTIGEPLIEAAIANCTDEAKAMQQYADMNRRAHGLSDSQDVLLGIAWVLPAEKRLFELFPHVVHLDCVEDTNKEKRPLLTATARDSTGNMFTFLRAFLPNQCAWVFRWLFQNVFPRMFGVELLSRIEIIITDGDSQETSQLDLAMKLYFPGAYRSRCVWHIVDRGMTKFFPKPLYRKAVNKKMYDKWEFVKKTVRYWIWSWSDSRCETKEEFKLSKSLFLNYVGSNQVKEALGPVGVEQLKEFFRKSVEPLEDLFVFYNRREKFHLDTSSNSAHEGTNHGIKYHSIAVKPTHGLVESTKILTQQSRLKSVDRKLRAAEYDTRKVAGWSELPTANHLTRLGESLLLAQWEQSFNHDVIGPCNNIWLVMGSVNSENNRRKDTDEFSCHRYPRFHRVRIVSRDASTGILKCSCNHFQRIGIVCRHLCRVLQSVHGKEFRVTKEMIRVFWWSKYYHFGTSEHPSHKSMLKLLLSLRDNDVKGPKILDENMPPNLTSFDPENNVVAVWNRPLVSRCENYSEKYCSNVLSIQTSTDHAPAMLSQDYCNYGESSEYIGENGGNPFDENAIGDAVIDSALVEDNKRNRQQPSDAYEVLNPLFKSIIAVLQSREVTQDDVEEAARDMLQIEEKFKHRFCMHHGGNDKRTRFVSSSLDDNPRRKTHGTKHM